MNFTHNDKTVEIRNDWNHTLSPSQENYLRRFLDGHPGRVHDVALTKGGYISVDFTRVSKDYPHGREIRGRRAGWISSILAAGKDPETGAFLDGFENDENGSTRFKYKT